MVAIARLSVVVQCLAASCDAKKVIWFPYKTGPDGLNETAGERGAKDEQKAGKQTCAAPPSRRQKDILSVLLDTGA